MKENLKLAAISVLIMYLITSFIVWELNVSKWDISLRIFLVCFSAGIVYCKKWRDAFQD